MPHEQLQLNLALLAQLEEAQVSVQTLGLGYAAFSNGSASRFGARDVRSAFTRSRRIGGSNLTLPGGCGCARRT